MKLKQRIIFFLAEDDVAHTERDFDLGLEPDEAVILTLTPDALLTALAKVSLNGSGEINFTVMWEKLDAGGNSIEEICPERENYRAAKSHLRLFRDGQISWPQLMAVTL